MSLDDLPMLLQALQNGSEADTQHAFADIAELTRIDPDECASALSRALLAESKDGELSTPRLLTLLGMTRQPSAECLPLCLDLLRDSLSGETSLPADALIGAAAVVARTDPRALLPDVATLTTNQDAPLGHGEDIARVLLPLLTLTSEFLRELPDSGVTDMARWLWADYAALDLMSLADFVGLYIEAGEADDSIIELFADIAERTRARPEEKRYAANRLAEAGADPSAVEPLRNAWRATAAAYPAGAARSSPLELVDPAPPAPDPRIDEYLAAFSEGDDYEYARAALDVMFEEQRPPFALTWWVAATADALPPWRRRSDVRWALLRASAAVRGFNDRISNAPPSVLMRWLETPQLLNPTDTWVALDLLGRQRPDLLVRSYLDRAVAASSGDHPEITLGEMWRSVTRAEPVAVLVLTSRWIAAGLGESPLLTLLITRLIEEARARPDLPAALEHAVSSERDHGVSEVARQLLAGLRDLPKEEPV